MGRYAVRVSGPLRGAPKMTTDEKPGPGAGVRTGQWQDLYHLSKMTLAGRRERQMELYAGSRMEQGNSTVQRTTPLKQNMIAWRRCTLAPDSAILR